MNGTTTFLLTQGVLGVACIVLGLVITVLYKDNNRLHSEKDALQEARRQDAQNTTDKVTAPLQSISQTVNLMYDKLRASKEA